jgi:hypothetical protein
MRTSSGIIAVVLGAVGVLVCAAAVGLGWWVAVKTADRVTRVAARLDQGLSEADAGLARVEVRLNAVRADLDEARGAAATLAAENPELPRVRSAIEQLLDRLVPAIDRAAAIADSLRSVAAGLRASADIVDQLGGETQHGRARTAADTIDRAAEALNVPRARIDAVKSAAAVRLTRELVDLAREAVAGSARLADGLAAARGEIAGFRVSTAERRDGVVFWVYVAAAANTLVWLWVGLGQLCLVGWGRRHLSGRAPPTP